ncbi:hypothetical protein ONE63_009520 [Megalurothrips usitatus]|uniref:Myb/SANT-like DNA-binding domain-containing protein n=1 Tax=Megalurothrips usitatus TaxID=439358 RepID=A0AAV7XJW8_9NEOP|nr:hypothetical protein ONE63_009520 [Megalurothrips usitatus]
MLEGAAPTEKVYTELKAMEPDWGPSGRANGKKGANWKTGTEELLSVCATHFREEMRLRVTSPYTWQKVSDMLYELHLDFSWEQCREKFRNLKQGYRNFKEKNKPFKFVTEMKVILDDPIVKHLADSSRVNLHESTGCFSEMQAAGSSIVYPEEGATGSDMSNVVPMTDSLNAHLDEATDFEDFLDKSFNLMELNDGNNDNEMDSIKSSELILDEANSPEKPEAVPNVFSPPRKKQVTFSPRKKQQQLLVHAKSKEMASIASPKRKLRMEPSVSATKMVVGFDDDSLPLFVLECVHRKGQVQKDPVPLATWKEISQVMKTYSYDIKWELCRDKFMNMNNMFRHVLKRGATLYGVKWPYYNQFCAIHDIDVDETVETAPLGGDNDTENDSEYEDLDDGSDNDSDSGKDDTAIGGMLWPPSKIRLLLSEYENRMSKFTNSKSSIKHSVLYGEISKAFLEHGVERSAKQCQAKMSELQQKFRKIFDRQRQTGQSPTKWAHYEKMLGMFKDSSNLDPPFVVTVGRSNKYIVKGKEMLVDVSHSTRTRVSNGNKKNKNTAKKQPKVFKSWQQTLQEEKVKASQNSAASFSQMADDFRSLREDFMKSCQERNLMFKSLLEKVQHKQ